MAGSGACEGVTLSHRLPGVYFSFFCSQASQSNQTRSSAIGSFQSLMKMVCKDQASFFSSSDTFLNLPRVNELLGDDKEKFNIPEDSSKNIVIHMCLD